MVGGGGGGGVGGGVGGGDVGGGSSQSVESVRTCIFILGGLHGIQHFKSVNTNSNGFGEETLPF